ncbi:glycosyl transferase family protein [Caballeronia hypogeia]|uniref:Glycosyl transferase family protein n=1 Tax=Caballeronia hypogeia TaxID=1777140 RepID=A0A158CG18_9BURK|nr:glycosyltransferase [Caballeronia hypogeia]SAK80467.1 glycosyl transferase family protein [Caballeronia hypogeia]
MINLAVGFTSAFLVTWLVVRYAGTYARFSLDLDLHAVQKMHQSVVPRVGGLAIFCGTAITFATSTFLHTSPTYEAFLLLSCATPAFIGGLAEDLTKRVTPRMRLLCALGAALAGCFVMGAVIDRVDLPAIDFALAFLPVGVLFTMIAVAGVTNAMNIVDGLNGLASVVAILIFASIGYVAVSVNDWLVASVAFAMIGAIGGFVVWNYPSGLVFLGDGGAYFIGFMMAELVVLLIARHPNISAFFAVVALYPAFETLFSIYRRRFVRGRAVDAPDALHLHTLIYKRIARKGIAFNDKQHATRRNSISSVYLWLLSLITIVPATFFWNSPYVLALSALAFVSAYVWIYSAVVRFRTPSWMLLPVSVLRHASRTERPPAAPDRLH